MFRTNNISLRKEGLEFRDLNCLQRVKFRKQHPDDNIHRTTESHIRRIIKNCIQRVTFRGSKRLKGIIRE